MGGKPATTHPQLGRGVWVDPETVDPLLAGLERVYRLMTAAKREPGKRFCESFPREVAPVVCEAARRHGFAAELSETNLDTARMAVSVVRGPTVEAQTSRPRKGN